MDANVKNKERDVMIAIEKEPSHIEVDEKVDNTREDRKRDLEMSDEEMIELIARRILKEHKRAFEELAK